jgi:Protein of unknown function (DUF1566)
MTTDRRRRQACTLWWALMCVVCVGVLHATPVWAGKETCLTGTDPGVAADAKQIVAVRALIKAACGCADFDGSRGHTHGEYVRCARGIITEQGGAGALRKQCKATLKKYYSISTCGVPARKDVVPCIKTTAAGKVTCAIKPSGKCVDSPPRYTQVACPGFSRCIDAADTDGDGIIGTTDSGLCATTNTPTPTFTQLPAGVPTPTPTRTTPPTHTFTSTPTITSTPTPRFQDNGDGTITDTQIGLMWEKKGDAGGIHDKDNMYAWSTCFDPSCPPDGTAFTVFLSKLNTSPCFAGHCNWRMPTTGELVSIVDTAAPGCGPDLPCVSAAFNTNCMPGCAPTNCSCTGVGYYWSSDACGVPFNEVGGALFIFCVDTDGTSKTGHFYVRAVR